MHSRRNVSKTATAASGDGDALRGASDMAWASSLTSTRAA
jgi:hypothetical protein